MARGRCPGGATFINADGWAWRGASDWKRKTCAKKSGIGGNLQKCRACRAKRGLGFPKLRRRQNLRPRPPRDTPCLPNRTDRGYVRPTALIASLAASIV